LAESLEDQARLNDISIVDRFSFYSGESELESLLDRWQAFDFDGVFIASSMAEGIQFIIDARKIGIDCPFLSGNALDSSALAHEGGKLAEGTIVCSVFDPASSRTEVRAFVEAFKKAYGETPDAKAALAYDAVWMLADAAQRAKNPSRASIAEELRGLGEWTGVCGTHMLSDTGDDLGDLVVIKELRGGDFVVPNK
jgi:branched-chain amino acid transport system substrate-binding protein